MARLIDVSKVINSMQKCLDESPDKRYSVGYFAFESIIECLKQEPTVDAVEVVRCRDCKNWHKFESSLIGEIMCCTVQGCMNVQKKADDFCSYGERKEGAE